MSVLYIWSVSHFRQLCPGEFKQANFLNHVFSIFNGGLCTLALSEVVVKRRFLTLSFPDVFLYSSPTVLRRPVGCVTMARDAGEQH